MSKRKRRRLALPEIFLAAAGGLLAVSGAFNSRIRALISAGAFGAAVCALFAALVPSAKSAAGRAKIA